MALTDLSEYELIDLVLADLLPDEKQYEIMETFLQAFSEALTDMLGSELKEEDAATFEQLSQDPTLTYEKLIKFYTDRIPHMEAKIIMLGLAFKKNFILSVYKDKLKQYTASQSQEGRAAWEQICKDAEGDRWHEVARLLSILKSIYAPEASSAK